MNDAPIPESPPPIVSTWTDPERESNHADRRPPTSGPKPKRKIYPRTTRRGRILACQALMLGAKLSAARAGSLTSVGLRSARRVRKLPPDDLAAMRERAKDIIVRTSEGGTSDAERQAALTWLTGEPQLHRQSVVESSVAAPTVTDSPCPPLAGDTSLERQRLQHRIRRRTLVLRRLLEPQAANDEMATALIELVDDIAAAITALDDSRFERI